MLNNSPHHELNNKCSISLYTSQPYGCLEIISNGTQMYCWTNFANKMGVKLVKKYSFWLTDYLWSFPADSDGDLIPVELRYSAGSGPAGRERVRSDRLRVESDVVGSERNGPVLRRSRLRDPSLRHCLNTRGQQQSWRNKKIQSIKICIRSWFFNS